MRCIFIALIGVISLTSFVTPSTATDYEDMFDAQWKYLGSSSKGAEVYINTRKIERYGPKTYFDLLLNRPADDTKIRSIVYFYEVVCTSNPSYGLNVNIFDAIGYYGKNGRDFGFRDDRANVKYYSREKMISTPFGKAVRYACNNARCLGC
jgi:hypothetical protein